MEEYKARPLTRRELKDLKKKGLSPVTMTIENADDVFDEVFRIVLGDEASRVDDLPNPEVQALFKKIMEATYGGPAEKNS